MPDAAVEIPCPTCAGPLELEDAYTWTTSPRGTWTLGYCPRCQRRYARDEHGKYAVATIRPRCPQCASTVMFQGLDRAAKGIVYACPFPGHPARWLFVPRKDQWIRL